MSDDALVEKMHRAMIGVKHNQGRHAQVKAALSVAKPEIEAPLIARIAELEAALAKVDPNGDLLRMMRISKELEKTNAT